VVADKASYHVTQQYKRHCYRKPKHGKQRLIDLPRSLMPELCAYIALLRKESLKAGNGGRVGRLFFDPKRTCFGLPARGGFRGASNWSANRLRQVSAVRRELVYGMTEDLGLSFAEVARLLGVFTSAVAKIVARKNSNKSN
jgi:hypothetical protein